MELPPEQQTYEVQYQTPPPQGNAATLVRLAAIFMLVAAGLHMLSVLIHVGMAIFIPWVMTRDPRVMAGPGSPPPIWIFPVMYGAYALVALAAAVVTFLGGMKLLKKRKGAFGWGLAAGIMCCLSIWCSIGCILPIGAGIYTIVILCLEHVRAYLRDEMARSENV